MVDNFSLPALNGIRSYEGRALRAYQDEVGVWTVGYGLTNMDKGLPWKVSAGLTITAEQAEWHLFKSLTENYVPAVRKALDPTKVSQPQGAQDGGLSFHFNTGAIGRASWPRLLMAGNVASAKASIESWNHAGGKVLSGLTKRRAWEWGVISASDYGHVTGPDELDQHERSVGTGELLTAFPTDPLDTSAGNVKTDGWPVPSTPAPGVIKAGSRGDCVTEIQTMLFTLGYPVVINGTFDDATAAAVRKFQGAHPNLTADGMVGPATTAAIKRDLAMRQSTKNVVVKAAPSLGALALAAWNFVHADAGEIVLVAGIAIVVASLTYVAWKHWGEVQAMVNKQIGRTVL